MNDKKITKKYLEEVVKEDNKKDPVDAVDDISSSYMTKINSQVNSPKAFANAVLDFINKVQDKEQMDFTKNQKIKQAMSYLQQLEEASEEDVENQKKMNQELEKTKELRDKLQTEADAEDVKRAQDLNKELETTKKHADDLTKASAASPIAEKIAQKVKERLEEEDDRMKDSLGTLLSIGDIIRGENNVRYQIRYSLLREEIVLQPVDEDEHDIDGEELSNVEDKDRFIHTIEHCIRIKRNIDVENSKAFINEQKTKPLKRDW